jgi:hypothetical protein
MLPAIRQRPLPSASLLLRYSLTIPRLRAASLGTPRVVLGSPRYAGLSYRQEKPNYWKNTCLSATLFKTNRTRSNLGLNPARRAWKTGTKHLSYDTAQTELKCNWALSMSAKLSTFRIYFDLGERGSLHLEQTVTAYAAIDQEVISHRL